MDQGTQRKMKVLESLDDLPAFANEAEEAEFWSTHELGEAILDQMSPIGDDEDLPPARPRGRPVELRFDDDTLARLKALADLKGKRYERLVREFIIERLYEEEKRAGLVGDRPSGAVGPVSATTGAG